MREKALCDLLGPGFRIKVLPADGDCFYTAIARGLGDGTTNESLRDIVASSLTNEQLENYRAVSFMDGYQWAASCDNLQQLQDQVRRPKTVWADETAISCLTSGVLGISLLILDEEGVEGGRKRGAGSGSKYIRIGSFRHDDVVILLTRSRRQHYNLVTYFGSGDSNLGHPSTLPDSIKRLFFNNEDESNREEQTVKKARREGDEVR